MFARKLRALGAPATLSVQLEDDTSVRDVILWIEQTQLLHLASHPEAQEKFFEPTVSIESWNSLLDEYLSSLACPFSLSDRAAVVDWLLRKCVAKEYSEMDCTFRLSHDASRVMVLRGGSTKGSVIERGQPQPEPFSGVDPKSEAFQSGINLLAGMLDIPAHLDPALTLQAVALVLQLLSEGIANGAPVNSDDPKDSDMPLELVPLGISVPDSELETPIRIIRLLHIANLRDLQTRFDAALVGLQQITANPQTDTALGKTGRG
ncbi:hypothetical protein BV898_13787 [Hypsibius exemplaris]|uniref:Uncharacterized protein n=1 Tax=Hypsibius exemplaris TaxID=2072580 RepID=A0A1W0W9R9_HYPEX|nr:hypothetical protein BV898_13787 [Hypsibius exemplaris]